MGYVLVLPEFGLVADPIAGIVTTAGVSYQPSSTATPDVRRPCFMQVPLPRSGMVLLSDCSLPA